MKKTLLLGALGLALALFVTLAPAPDASAATIIGHPGTPSAVMITSETSLPAITITDQAALTNTTPSVFDFVAASSLTPVAPLGDHSRSTATWRLVRGYDSIFDQATPCVVNTLVDGTSGMMTTTAEGTLALAVANDSTGATLRTLHQASAATSGMMAATSSGGTKAPVVADSNNTGATLDAIPLVSAVVDPTATQITAPAPRVLAASSASLPTTRAAKELADQAGMADSTLTLNYPNPFNKNPLPPTTVATLVNDGSALMASGHQSLTPVARTEWATTTEIKGDRATSPHIVLVTANPRHTRTVALTSEGGRKHCRDVALAAMWPSGMSARS